jgi:uncharacterized membrane protein YdjX (TVP38/TMEM64 family)
MTILKIAALAVLTIVTCLGVILISAHTGVMYGPLMGFVCGIGYGSMAGKGLSWLMWRAFPVKYPPA